MHLTLVDHLLTLSLLILMPMYAVWDFQRLEARIQAGEPGARVRGYQQIIAMEWFLVAAIAVLWAVTGRGAPELGLGFELGSLWWLGVPLTVIALVLIAVQLILAIRRPEKLSENRAEFEELRVIIPGTEQESRWFNALSITAGICEEIIYRGFLIAYFAVLVGTPAALVLSSVVFGLGHSYQGRRGVVKITVVGLVLGGLYLLTGSLWAPILVHIVVDIVSGTVARRAFQEPVPA